MGPQPRPEGSPDDRRHRATPARTSGRIALGAPVDERLDALVAGRSPRPLPLPDDPWAATGTLAVGVVDDDPTHAAALDAALRGADVIVEVAPEWLGRFVDDVERSAVGWWHPASEPSPGEWAPLLDALAAGDSTEEAARRCNVSLRSAHRRLAEARVVLGVSTTAAAVASWSAGHR